MYVHNSFRHSLYCLYFKTCSKSNKEEDIAVVSVETRGAEALTNSSIVSWGSISDNPIHETPGLGVRIPEKVQKTSRVEFNGELIIQIILYKLEFI